MGLAKPFEKGNEQYLSGHYQYAITTFNQVLAKDSSNLAARRLLAESYRLSNRIEASLPHYQKLAKEDPNYNTHFFLAQSLKANQKWAEAKLAFEAAAASTSDERLQARVKQELAVLPKVEQITNYYANYQLVNYNELNTPSADYAL